LLPLLLPRSRSRRLSRGHRKPSRWDLQNMTCALCPITVKKSLQQVPDVAGATIELDKKTAIVTFDPDRTSAAVLTKATADAGYPSTVHN
jgi:periplasmic mercuric ion binding protein